MLSNQVRDIFLESINDKLGVWPNKCRWLFQALNQIFLSDLWEKEFDVYSSISWYNFQCKKIVLEVHVYAMNWLIIYIYIYIYILWKSPQVTSNG